MKKSLFLYLFILALLVNIFTYMYYSKENSFQREELAKTTKVLSDSVSMLKNKLSEAEYFSYETNQQAQDYFEKTAGGEFVDYQKLIPYVKEKLVGYNDDPKGNKYVGFDMIDGKKFIINHVKVINHRWIIADFNNTDIWGEVILKYFINDDRSVDFETAETLIYPKQ
ncbi:hypothetical protein HYN48_11705 [Flavobacterium magnum]|uniref:Hydrolase n=1 Tax=Flavobacterium magnum TaxID=2162713 RepID=A0A2S0RFI1_9FLAO|nr:hypothetical protein [Flavobacterium magnum]AWA30697.1 hypothetical protein HYN48_11705 [Flavobacterium magnum]